MTTPEEAFDFAIKSAFEAVEEAANATFDVVAMLEVRKQLEVTFEVKKQFEELLKVTLKEALIESFDVALDAVFAKAKEIVEAEEKARGKK